MSGSSGGGSDKPPRPELPGDPLQHPASNAGWDDDRPRRSRTPTGAATSGGAAASVEVAPSAPEPAVAKPAAAEPAAAKPAAPEPAATKPAAPEQPAAAKPAPEPAATKPAAAEPAVAKPAAPEPAAAKPPVPPRDPVAADAAPSPRALPYPAFIRPDMASARPADTTPPSSTSAAPPGTSSAKPSSDTTVKPPSTSSAALPSPATTKPSNATTKPSSTTSEEPLLPATYHENDLRSAVGASPLSEPAAATARKRRAEASDHRRDDDSDESQPRPRNRKLIVVSAISITAGLATAVLAFLGYANSDRYFLACEAERAIPEQGRGFPPWGSRALDGEAWKPLKIAPETRCQPHETDDRLALERLYLSMIMDQVTALLTAREVTRLEDAEALLKQALLLTRPPAYEPEKLAKERSEHHKEIERLLGDVTYWRASAKLREAATALGEAAKQFDSAAAQHPRHVSDASAWATYARKLAQELHTGPTGTPATPSAVSPAAPPAASPTAPPAASPASPSAAPPAASGEVPISEHPNAPMGVALPVEPDQGSATGSANEPSPAPAPPDAGVPTGGVLL